MTHAPHAAIGKRCIIRTYASGVHLGTVVSAESNEGRTRCELADTRRIRYWNGATSLSEMSQKGLETARSQVCDNVPQHFIEDVIEIIPATDAAIATIEAATNVAK